MIRPFIYNRILSDKIIRNFYSEVMGDDKLIILDAENISEAHDKYIRMMRKKGCDMNSYWLDEDLPVFITATDNILNSLNIRKEYINGKTIDLPFIYLILSKSYKPREVDELLLKAGIFGFLMTEGIAISIKYPNICSFGNPVYRTSNAKVGSLV